MNQSTPTQPGTAATRVLWWQRALSLRGLTLLLGGVFLLSLLTGLGLQAVSPQNLSSGREAQYATIEMVFGQYRAAVREGQAGAMAVCATLVVGINSLGSVLRTITSVLLLPALADLVSGGLAIGRGLLSLHGSSWLSVPAFVAMAALEWCTYVLSAAAGANVGLALIFPRLQSGAGSRREAFQKAARSGLRVYLVIVAILLVQAVVEILYVHQVLVRGGTGVPLEPY